MKKYFLYTLIITATLSIALSANADEKFITLTDGSSVKGEVVSAVNGIYTIKTNNFGTVELNEEDIVSIANQPLPAANPAANSAGPDPAMMNQIMQVQQELMADPQIMNQIQKLLENPEVMETLSDKQFMNDVMSYDPNRIENNQRTEQLLENPQIQDLMEKIENKLGVEGEPEE